MNRFFVPNEVYEDRITICKSCVFYFKPTGTCKDCGCFMKIKARLAPMECSQKKWQKTTEILDMWKDLKTGRAKDQAAKKRMIETYNTIYNTNYNVRTNCGSCIATCFDGIKKLYKEYAKG